MVTLLVVTPKPAPLSFNEFNTIKSKFLDFSFLIAFSSSSLVSKAKPTSNLFCFIFPKDS